MDDLLTALQFLLAGWVLAGIFLGLLGGFDLIRRTKAGEKQKTAAYWLTLSILYPVILLRAFLWALWYGATPR
jgi:hypothetical protein